MMPQQHTTSYYRCTAGLCETHAWFAYTTVLASLSKKNLRLTALVRVAGFEPAKPEGDGFTDHCDTPSSQHSHKG